MPSAHLPEDPAAREVFPDTLGARFLGDGRTRFRVWAPLHDRVELHLVAPIDRIVALSPEPRGYHAAVVADVHPGARYFYRFPDGEERPDPFSRFQPEGVHAASQVVDPGFAWRHDFPGIPLEDWILYELHVGTFTPEGTFEAAIGQLDRLRDLGVNALELLPLNQFPGGRNWGYDGVYVSAVQDTYGGPDGLKRFVDAAHARGMAVVLDVVYNHIGPEGNYLPRFGHYFTERYRTPWGPALNFDGEHSDEVRRYFVESALYYLDECRIDGLRIDAVHAIADESARTFLEVLGDAAHRLAAARGRTIPLIAESSRNDPRTVLPVERHGIGLDGVWNDDFHHAVHVRLTGEREGYYADFDGGLAQLAKAFGEGFVYTGEYSPARKRSHGRPADEVEPHRLVVFVQNHDQVGNRMKGDRLSTLVAPEKLRFAAAALLLSPFTPMLFMGEEYGETAPFPYFISHGDPGLVEAVRKGRAEEFAEFAWAGDVPDPQAEDTFRSAVIRPGRAGESPHAATLALHRRLLALRRAHASITRAGRAGTSVRMHEKAEVLEVRRSAGDDATILLLHAGEGEVSVHLDLPRGRWARVLDTSMPPEDAEAEAARTRIEGGGGRDLRIAPWNATMLAVEHE